MICVRRPASTADSMPAACQRTPAGRSPRTTPLTPASASRNVALMHSVLSLSGDSGDPIDPAVWMARYNPPDNEAPAAIGASGVIGRSADAAVMLMGLTRYTNGLQI